MEVKCPRCARKTEYSPANPYRPFCSERCKLIDLGAWADGAYSIPVQGPVDPDELESALEEALNQSADDDSQQASKKTSEKKSKGQIEKH